MLTAHELFGFMPATLANEIFEYFFSIDKPGYRAVMAKVAEARRVRPVFLERQPRAERHQTAIATLSKPNMDIVAGNLLQTWLIKQHAALLGDFLDALGIAHKEGVVDNLPDTVADDALKGAVDKVLAKHRREVVAVYLHAFNTMNDTKWANLDAMLQADSRLQF